jgi:hypothetical protein
MLQIERQPSFRFPLKQKSNSCCKKSYFCNSCCFILNVQVLFAGSDLANRGRGKRGVLVLIDILIELGFQVVNSFVNSLVQVKRGSFGNHLLLFHCGTDADFGLMVPADLHNNPDTGYLEVGVVGKQRFDPGGGVASDQFSGFKIPSGDDDLHSLSFLKICFLHSKTLLPLQLGIALHQ